MGKGNSKYDIETINQAEREEIIQEKYSERDSFGRKANLAGTCIKLLTTSKEFKNMWENNFKFMNEDIRPHGRIFALPEADEKKVYYEPKSETCFILGYDYYGYVKSLALAVAGDFLEEYHSIHSRHSVHGAAIDHKGVGTAIIAPSGVGKSTQSYGLLLEDNVRLIADDWFYTTLVGENVEVQASEKNSYIRIDIASDFEEYEKLVRGTSLDNFGRAVVNVRKVLGKSSMKEHTTLRNIVHLKRDPDDDKIIRELETDEALDFILEKDFCNPHQLIQNGRKKELRKDFFKKMYNRTNVYLINTTTSIEENKKQIKEIVKK